MMKIQRFFTRKEKFMKEIRSGKNLLMFNIKSLSVSFHRKKNRRRIKIFSDINMN